MAASLAAPDPPGSDRQTLPRARPARSETGWMARPGRVRPASARTLMNIRISSWSCDTAPRLSQRPLEFYAQSASRRTALSHGAGRLNLGCIRAHAPIWQAEEAPELELSSPKGALRAARRARLDRRDCERQPKDPLGKADAVRRNGPPAETRCSTQARRRAARRRDTCGSSGLSRVGRQRTIGSAGPVRIDPSGEDGS